MTKKKKYNYKDLDLIIERSKLKNQIFQPSSFWSKASKKIKNELEQHGIHNFRNLKTCLGFFVPNYGIPANSFNKEISNEIFSLLKQKGSLKQNLAMKSFLNGYYHALSDFRVFISSQSNNGNLNTKDFSESDFGNPVEQFEFEGKKFSRSALNYLLGICFLKKHLDKNEKINTVLEIGGGFGTLGEILSFTENVKYINIDIPPISFISWNYLKNIYQKNINSIVKENNDKINIIDLNRCSVFNSWDIEKLNGKIDLFTNFISFQEMEPHIVQNYFKNIIRLKPKWILLRNIREGKRKKKSKNEHGVEIPIKSKDYIEMIEDKYELINKDVLQFGYKTSDGFHSELLLFKKSKKN